MTFFLGLVPVSLLNGLTSHPTTAVGCAPFRQWNITRGHADFQRPCLDNALWLVWLVLFTQAFFLIHEVAGTLTSFLSAYALFPSIITFLYGTLLPNAVRICRTYRHHSFILSFLLQAIINVTHLLFPQDDYHEVPLYSTCTYQYYWCVSALSTGDEMQWQSRAMRSKILRSLVGQ